MTASPSLPPSSPSDTTSLIIASLVAVATAVTAAFTWRANRLASAALKRADEANLIASEAKDTAVSDLEITVDERLQASDEVLRFANEIALLLNKQHRSNADEARLSDLERLLPAHIEKQLNRWEQSCVLYLQGRLNRDRFKQLYRASLRATVEASFNQKYLVPPTTPYRNIIRVYDEWEHGE
jgi:hypothetical protein